jgi:hypothetical protein
LSIFRKSVEKIQVTLEFDQNSKYFIWKPMYKRDNIFVMRTNLVHYLSLIYFVTQPLHVSGVCCPSSGSVRKLVRIVHFKWTVNNKCPKYEF